MEQITDIRQLGTAARPKSRGGKTAAFLENQQGIMGLQDFRGVAAAQPQEAQCQHDCGYEPGFDMQHFKSLLTKLKLVNLDKLTFCSSVQHQLNIV